MLVRTGALGGSGYSSDVCLYFEISDGREPRYGAPFWYAYYVFMMGLPLLMLILSLMTDSSENVRQRKIFVCSGFAVYAVLL